MISNMGQLCLDNKDFLEELYDTQNRISSKCNPNFVADVLDALVDKLLLLEDDFPETKFKIEDILSFAMMYDEGMNYSYEIEYIIETFIEEAGISENN